MNKKALITGASAGIGEACAKILAKAGYDLILTARRMDRLTSLSEHLKSQYPNISIHTIQLDVRDRAAVQDSLQNLPAEWQNVDVLINNAGLSLGLEPIDTGETDDWDIMIDTNIKGLLYVTRAITPSMTAQGYGHIINIGSIAGKEVYPNGNVYCATKHAVDALTKGMRMDLLAHGIKVTAIHPGMVETEFSIVRFKGDEERAQSVYHNLEPLVAEDIAEAVWFAVSRPAHVNINDMLIMPTIQANATNIRRN